MEKIVKFAKKEAVLVITFICACISAFIMPPSREYLGYIDFSVLSILFTLMLVIAGFQKCNVFIVLAQKLLCGKKNMILIGIVLISMPFFCSMFITNDVALITFVPFTILVLTMLGRKENMILIIVLQTVAANLGSMATPFGNPQNLFLYTKFNMSAADFLGTMGVFTAISFLLLILGGLFVKRETLEVKFPVAAQVTGRLNMVCYVALFALCLFSVLKVVPFWVSLVVVVAFVLIRDRDLLLQADYGLIATFVCFFIFSGNMGRIPEVQAFLGGCMAQSPTATGIITSQVISNVPAAVLLSNFTNDVKSLLIGTNLGGLGTIIASLASLISFKFYIKQPDAKPFKYLAIFTVVNILALSALLFVHSFVD